MRWYVLDSDTYDWAATQDTAANEVAPIVHPMRARASVAASACFHEHRRSISDDANTHPWIHSMTGMREWRDRPAGLVMLRLRHSNSFCFSLWQGNSASSTPNRRSSQVRVLYA